ncbi:MAG: Tad domain-containing protein [Acidobacteria bacterium]|nr:Tad domain-containing protein [Acidobacteriota bacterium]
MKIQKMLNRAGRSGNGRARRGFSLLVTASTAVIMAGVLGLAFDCGRMFIIKNELQTFCDSAALASARNLDGTKTGVDLAHLTALHGPLGTSLPNAVNFDSKKITDVTDTYANTFTGTYYTYANATATATNTYRFVKVDTQLTIPLYFLGAVSGNPGSVVVSASATGGQLQQPALFNNGGLLPFSPAAHNPADRYHFGLIPGVRYTLKWGKHSASTDCPGDLGWSKANAFPAQRGYVDLGQGNGASGLRQAIEFGGFPNGIDPPTTVAAGDYVDAVPGNKAPSLTAITARSLQDPDQTSTTWEVYKAKLQQGVANGRRLVTVLIDDPDQSTPGGNGNYREIGFGEFLLDPAAVYETNDQSGNGSYCATYIGPANLSGGGTGGTSGTSVYKIVLFK